MGGITQSKIILLVLCLSELVVVGMLLFSHGFLLNRQVIHLKSSCDDFKMVQTHKTEKSGNNTESPENECWVPPVFRRAVVLLVDALRYDFAVTDPYLNENEALPYQNKLPIFKDLIDSKPGQAYLAPFVADAPTTTMQRLKGLTTGGLPTFIDISHNFARYNMLYIRSTVF